MSEQFFNINFDKNEKIKINFNKKDENIKYNTKIFEESNNIIDKIKKSDLLKNKFVKNIFENFDILIDDINYLFLIFNIDYEKSYSIRAKYIDNQLKYYIKKINEDNNENQLNIEKNNIKYNTLIQNMVSKDMYEKIKNMKYCDRQLFLTNYYLTVISYLFNILNNNGNFFISFFNYCNEISIEIIYILSLMFEKVTICNGIYIYCSNFLGNNSLITKENIEKCIKNNNFSITPKKDLSSLLKYLEYTFIQQNHLNKLLLDKKYDEYIDLKINRLYDNILLLKNKDVLEYFYKKIFNIVKRTIIDKKVVKIGSSIKEIEGNFIIKNINENNYKKCLEIGFACGISAFYILSIKTTNLISIDPFQSTQWNNSGKKTIKELGFNKRHKCIEKKSYEALPQLLQKCKKTSDKFDFIFIDGWHTFDYTLVDFFYSNLLLRIDGMIIIDDALHAGVAKCVKYLDTNYLFYKKINSPNTVACYKKIKEDDRPWNFNNFF
jgi:predicted O-methyltransferase YrrM